MAAAGSNLGNTGRSTLSITMCPVSHCPQLPKRTAHELHTVTATVDRPQPHNPCDADRNGTWRCASNNTRGPNSIARAPHG